MHSVGKIVRQVGHAVRSSLFRSINPASQHHDFKSIRYDK